LERVLKCGCGLLRREESWSNVAGVASIAVVETKNNLKL